MTTQDLRTSLKILCASLILSVAIIAASFAERAALSDEDPVFAAAKAYLAQRDAQAVR